mgnify:CR=1 FL=1
MYRAKDLRPQHVPALLVRDEREPRRAPDAGNGSVERARAQTSSRLHYQPKVDLQTGRDRRHWKRCCAGSIRPRDDPAGAVHSDRRGKQPDRRDRQLGDPRGVRAEPGLAGRRAAARCRSPSTSPARQLHDRTWSPTVRAALATRDLRPQYLEIELTESAVMSNIGARRSTTLSLLREMGVQDIAR